MAAPRTFFLFGLAVVGCAVDFHVGARPPDEAPDASTSDASANDASTAEAGADAGIPTWCDGVVAEFCADFEKGEVGTGWDSQLTNGGVVEIDPNRGRESARSAAFRLPYGSESASLVKILPGPWRPTAVEFDAFVASADAGDTPTVALMHVGLDSDVSNPNAGKAFFLAYVTSTGVTLRVLSPDVHEMSSTKPFPLDHWVRVAFEVDWEKKSASIALDGEPFVTYDAFPSALPPFGTTFETRVRLGAFLFDPPRPALKVNHDNVTVVRR